MIFTKPKDVRYVDMCIFIDDKVSSGEELSSEDAQLIYEYLYHIIYMLASKHKYFNKSQYYDEFAITLAGDVFHRLISNPKLKQFDENGNPKLSPIKSCLNYIKAIIGGRKITYEQKAYSQKYINIDDVNTFDTPLRSVDLFNTSNFKNSSDTSIYISNISTIIKTYLQSNCPYVCDKVLYKNIYTSCLLSILNAITFTCEDSELIQNTYVTMDSKFRFLCKKYNENRSDCIVMYHLDEKYKSYLTILVRKLFKLICDDIKELNIADTYVPEEILVDIAFAEIRGDVDNDY